MSFNVPSHPNTRVRGLNICIVYARSADRRYQYWDDGKFWSWYAYYIKVYKKTKGLKLVYSPTFIGISGPDEDMRSLSHWKLGNHLEVGNEVSVSVVGWSYTFLMKELGICLVYDEREGEKLIGGNSEKNKQIIRHDPNYTSHNSAIDRDFSAYHFSDQEYFLSNPDYFRLRASSSDVLQKRVVLYEHLFEDSVRTAGSTQEEEGGEDDESSYDFPDIIYEEVEEEVEELLAASASASASASEWWH